MVHFKDKDPETKLLVQPTESFDNISYLDQISPFVHVKNDSGNKGSVVKKVELFWPHSLLQVDQPYLPVKVCRYTDSSRAVSVHCGLQRSSNSVIN